MIVTIAIIAGTGIAVATVILTVRALRNRVEQMAPTERPKWAVAAATVVAIAAFPFAWWAAMILGGNLGGAFAASFSEAAGSQGIWVPVGIGLGIATVTTVVVVALAITAFGVARIAQRR